MSSESKSNAESYITPYQSLGNLKPTMGQSNLGFGNSMMHMGQNNDRPGAQNSHYQPSMVPSNPIDLRRSLPMMIGGQQPYQAMQSFRGESNVDVPQRFDFQDFNPTMLNGHNPYNSHRPTTVITRDRANNQLVDSHGPSNRVYGPINHYGPSNAGEDTKGRKIIGYKTVMEKRKVAVVTMTKQPVVRMKKVITKVPTIRMVTREVLLPKY
ncbi:unnamed protein product [Mytilus coruscus]|uniref:Uncharacterized protein n=1 Tax=Mytilus coruscus TaxID=42192 RepID=A0A6J8C6I5_MYTCO|nr:unnamed protein product [Mytilus coruscus]